MFVDAMLGCANDKVFGFGGVTEMMKARNKLNA